MTTRRDYLRLSALAAAAGCTLRGSALPTTKTPQLSYGIQIAGVRQAAEQDLPNLLQALRHIGFEEVEVHSVVYNHPAAMLRTMIEDAGLRVSAGHFSLSSIKTSLDYARALGLTYMVSMLPRLSFPNLDPYRRLAGQLNQAGTSARNNGMEFALLFHNHELMPQDGSSGFAELMKHTDPTLVRLEVDVYWIVQAGIDPAAFLKEHKLRVKLLHLKDRLPGFPTSYTTDACSDHSTVLGEGAIPWPALLKQARRQGIHHAFLDYDQSSIPILDSLEQSFAYLKRLKDGHPH